MNFVLHHRLARRDLAEPAAAVGAMLPDLWRMADRHVRPAREPVGEEQQGGRVADVLAGVAHHGRADASFHASDPFKTGERWMAVALAAIRAPRMPLFAHIAWELCLDGALVRRSGESLLRDVREGVGCALEELGEEAAVEAAARIHHAARKGEALPSGFHARMARMLAEIERGPWIEGYAYGDRVAERLEMIRSRLAFPPIEVAERAALAALLDGAIARADDALDAVLALPA